MHKCIPNGMSANYTVQASGWLWPFSKSMDVSVLGIGIRSRKYADTLLRACVYPDTPLRWPPYLRRYAIMPIAAYNSICRHADRCLYAETLLIAVVRPSLHVTFLRCFAGVPIGSNCIITHYADMPIAVLTPTRQSLWVRITPMSLRQSLFLRQDAVTLIAVFTPLRRYVIDCCV